MPSPASKPASPSGTLLLATAWAILFTLVTASDVWGNASLRTASSAVRLGVGVATLVAPTVPLWLPWANVLGVASGLVMSVLEAADNCADEI